MTPEIGVENRLDVLRIGITGTGSSRTVSLPRHSPLTVHQSYAETTVCKLLRELGYDMSAPVDFLDARGDAYLSVPSASWVLELSRGRRGVGRRELLDQVLAYDRATRHSKVVPITDIMAVLTADLANISAMGTSAVL